jgi:hypothetical protein
VIIQQERNEATTASDVQLIAAVVNRQGGPGSRLAFEVSTTSNQLGFHDLSDLLRRALQELPKAEKDAIHFASKGISWREIAAKKIVVETETARQLFAQ